jgi:predicted nucleic acid-binding protein
LGLLVDTSVIVRLEHEDADLDEFITSLQDEEAAISAITASELLVGVLRGAPEQRRIQREAFTNYVLDRFAVLPFDLNAARIHARLWTMLATGGNMVGLNDLLIAATALAGNHAVLTDNVRDFSRVPGLKVRSQLS